MEEYQFLEHHARALYRLLNHGENYSDCRCIDVNKSQVIDRSVVKGEQAVIDWAKRFNGKGNCFIGRNPRNSDGTVRSITTWSFDIDPVRPKGQAASDVQTQRALFWGRRILQDFGGKGYVASSGNGALVLFRLSIPVDKEFKAFESKLSYLQVRIREQVLNISEVICDQTHDSARLIKIIGTMSTKGDKKDWRISRFIDIPSPPYKLSDAVTTVVLPNNGSKPDTKLYSEKQRTISPSDSLKSVEQAMAHLSPQRVEDYNSWLQVGMALRGFGDVGFELWRDWSRKSNKYEEGICESKWQSFTRTILDSSPKIGIGTIIKWANDDSPSGHEKPIDEGLYGFNLVQHRDDLLSRGKRGKPELCIGISGIDHHTWGLVRGELFTVAARTGIGKTSFATSITRNLLHSGKRVVFFSTEMAAPLIINRLLSCETGIGGDHFQTGSFTPEQLEKLDRGYAWLSECNKLLTICDSSSPDATRVFRTTKQVEPDVIIFDHIQRVGGTSDSPRHNISGFVRQLKDISRKTNCAVVVLSQLRRMFRDIKTGLVPPPMITDLKESGTIEEESGQVLLLSTMSEMADNPVCQLLGDLAKNRFGQTCKVGIEFDRATARFSEIGKNNEE